MTITDEPGDGIDYSLDGVLARALKPYDRTLVLLPARSPSEAVRRAPGGTIRPIPLESSVTEAELRDLLAELAATQCFTLMVVPRADRWGMVIGTEFRREIDELLAGVPNAQIIFVEEWATSDSDPLAIPNAVGSDSKLAAYAETFIAGN